MEGRQQTGRARHPCHGGLEFGRLYRRQPGHRDIELFPTFVSTRLRILSFCQSASVDDHSSEMVAHMEGPARLRRVGRACSLEMYVYLKKWKARNA